jgi:hypothetical protein
MGSNGKTFTLMLILMVSISSVVLLTAKSANAESAMPTFEWSKTYSPTDGLSVSQASDNGFIIAGINVSGFHDSLSYSTTVIKTDSLGNIQWEKQFGDNFRLLFPLVQVSITQTSDSGYILTTPSSTVNELIKLDSKGNIEWQTQVSGGKAIEVNDGYIVSGFSADSTYNEFSNVTKVNSKGQIQWIKNFDEGVWVNGVQGKVGFRALSKTMDGNYAIAGYWGSSFWFGLMDTNGNLLVNKTYPQDGHSNGFSSISNTSDSGFILCGWNGNADAVLYSVDGQGNLEWNSTYTKSGAFTSVIQTANNEYLAGTNFGFIVNINSNGYQNSAVNCSSSINGMANTRDSGLIVTGLLNDRLWLAKFNLESNSSPSPTVPELSWFVVVPLLLSVLAFAIIVRHRKTAKV